VRRTCGRVRKMKQKLRRRYTIDRENRQLAGDEPTVPLGAVRSEVVDPASQGCQPLPALVRQALRESWATPDAAKARAVAEIMAAFFDPGTKPGERIRLVRTLLLADRTQYELDHPELARKGRRRR